MDKTPGGTTTSWVRLKHLLKQHALGLAERRASWFVKGTRQTAGSRYVHVKSFQKALGRAALVASALELIRPFWSPLCAFTCSGAKEGMRAVPSYVALFICFLASPVERERYSRCSADGYDEDLEPRVDAQASDTRTGLGCWRPVRTPDGSLRTANSSWFLEEIG